MRFCHHSRAAFVTFLWWYLNYIIMYCFLWWYTTPFVSLPSGRRFGSRATISTLILRPLLSENVKILRTCASGTSNSGSWSQRKRSSEVRVVWKVWALYNISVSAEMPGGPGGYPSPCRECGVVLGSRGHARNHWREEHRQVGGVIV